MLDPRLKHVIAVAQRGSFTAAANSVGVTQSALTRSVASLERKLGYAVFDRTPRGALITEKGRHFVDRATRLLEDARELLDDTTEREDAFAGVLRIGVCPACLSCRLTEPVAQLQARHPSIRFEISGSSFERMVQQLRNGSWDIVIGFDEAFGEWPDLYREPVGELRSRLYVRNGHPILRTGGVTLATLSNFNLVSTTDSRPYGATLRNIYESQGIDWRKRLNVIDYFPTARRLVASSDAIGVVALPDTAAPAFKREFTTLDQLDLFPPAPLCCATRARWDPSPAMRAFIGCVRRDLAGVSPEVAARQPELV